LTQLHYLSATQVLAGYRSGVFSPVEVFEAVQARADAVDPVVNCLLERDPEGARAAAKAATERYAGRGEEPRPLEGLPVVVKEEQPISGRSLRS
jgi:amidase